MRLTLRQLQIFRTVARYGSTTAAARNVPLSQSATSAAVNELERTLGAALFDRVGKRLILNDAGRALLPQALAVLDGARQIEETFGSGGPPQAGHLQIDASTTVGNYVLPAVLARYRGLHPEAHLELRIGNTLDVVTAVREFRTDVGFIEGPCHASDVVVTPWLTDELVIVASPAHPLAVSARRRALGANDLMRALWLLREPGSGTREAVEQALMQHLPGIRSSMILGSSEAIKHAAAAGLGLSCLSRWAVQDLVNAHRLAVLATRLPRLTRRLSWIRHRSKVLSTTLRDFIEVAAGAEAPSARARRPTSPGRRRRSC